MTVSLRDIESPDLFKNISLKFIGAAQYTFYKIIMLVFDSLQHVPGRHKRFARR